MRGFIKEIGNLVVCLSNTLHHKFTWKKTNKTIVKWVDLPVIKIGSVNYFLKTLINKAFSFLEDIQLSLYVW